MGAEEPLARARVDAALDWHHGTIRVGCAGQVSVRSAFPPPLMQPRHQSLRLQPACIISSVGARALKMAMGRRSEVRQ